jgi:MFS family permease
VKLSERFPALASRDFAIFWVGQFVSLIGTWMQNTTLPYLAYRLTGSALDLGLIGFSATLPTLLLALPGGVFVERLDKRKVVIWMQVIEMLQAFGLAALALTGTIRIWHIIALSFVLGSASAIEITARQAMLVELVGKPSLPNAIALQSMIFNTARVVGPSLTAVVLLLVSNQGEGWAFFANGVSFLFVIIGLFFVRTPFKSQRETADLERFDLVGDMRESWGYIRGNAIVLLIILLAGWMGFFGFPFGQLIPAVARDMLHLAADTEAAVQARTSGLYLAQGVGALITALFVSAFSHIKRKGVLMVIGESIFALSLVAISFTRNIPLTMVLAGIMGLSLVMQNMMMNILIQIDVPDSLRGRVFSVYLWALQGVAPFGSLFIGWLAQTAGIPRAAQVGGLLCLLAVLFIHIKYPVIVRKNS